MLKIIKSVIAPIASLAILVMGDALFVTHTSVRLKMGGYSINTIGYIVGGYFAGLLIGSFCWNRIIERVGHIRAYTAMATLLTVLAMFQALSLKIWIWALVRFAGGICIGGLFVVIESWLLAKSTPTTKGKVLSIYMISFYASQGLSQFLLNVADPFSIVPFAIVVILSAISIIPVSITKMSAPIIQEPSNLKIYKLFKTCPLGMLTCVFSGFLLGPIYGLVPVYTKEIGMTIEQIAYASSSIILGGFLFQWPIGQISDKLDRRKVISLTGFCAALCALIITFLNSSSAFLLFLFLAMYGGFSFTVYPQGISHGSDTVEAKDLIAATAGFSIAYSVGAIIGPMIASFSMTLFGPKGLFIYSATVSAALGLMAIITAYQKSSVTVKEKKSSSPTNYSISQNLEAESQETLK